MRVIQFKYGLGDHVAFRRDPMLTGEVYAVHASISGARWYQVEAMTPHGPDMFDVCEHQIRPVDGASCTRLEFPDADQVELEDG